ncbi:MAG TPA: hypothetical protein DGG94_23080 [Micromonosporaceae bacterium]|nr:hypothetical protein [Micromonosporaceae bacterium]HCU52636.1 hypothetical protein [Micromonosporaceae bacterium]
MTVILAVVLVWTGAFKLFSRKAPLAAAQSGLTRLVGTTHVVKAFRALGAIELAVAASLLVTPLASAVLFTGFLGYLAYTRLAAPGSSCGCASAQPSPIGWRNFTFTSSLLALSLMLFVDMSIPTVALMVVSLALALITPDLDQYWLYPLRRLKVRLTHPLKGAYTSEVPLHATVQQLQRSEAYQRVGSLLRSDVVESWDEGEWRLVRYTVQVDEKPANAIFAVPRLVDEPERVRLAIVE